MLPYRDSRIVRIVLVVFFITLLCYAIFEAQGLLYGPVIDVFEDAIVVSAQFTVIRGRAERITELRLNGKTISVTENGEFEEPYLLAAGSNRLILDARDARGRSTRKIIDIVYNPQNTAPSPQPSTPTATSSDEL